VAPGPDRSKPEAGLQELPEARAGVDDVHPHGSRDAEAVYKKNPGFATDVASGDRERAMPAGHAVQRETEIRADRFAERFRDLKQTGDCQYVAGNYSGYKAARAEMGNMTKSPERDPQMESLLEGRKKQLGIDMDFDSGMRLGQQLSLSHGLGRSRGVGLYREELSYLPPFLRHSPTLPEYLLHNDNSLPSLASAIVRNNQQGAAQPCLNQTVSSV